MELKNWWFVDAVEGADYIMVNPLWDEYDRKAQKDLITICNDSKWLPKDVPNGLIEQIAWIEPQKVFLKKGL